MVVNELKEFKEETEYIVIANEFAYVMIRKVSTRNGPKLEIYSPRLDRRVYLDPLELESLTWATKDIFDALLKTPWGPD